MQKHDVVQVEEQGELLAVRQTFQWHPPEFYTWTMIAPRVEDAMGYNSTGPCAIENIAGEQPTETDTTS